MFACPATDDFFRSRIYQLIDLRQQLAVLSSLMPWQQKGITRFDEHKIGPRIANIAGHEGLYGFKAG